MTPTQKLTLFSVLFLSSSFSLSKPIPVDGASLSFEPPMSMIVPEDATPALSSASGVDPSSAGFPPTTDVGMPTLDSSAQVQPTTNSMAQVQPTTDLFISETPVPSPVILDDVASDVPLPSDETPDEPPNAQETSGLRVSQESLPPQPPADEDSIVNDTVAVDPEITPVAVQPDEADPLVPIAFTLPNPARTTYTASFSAHPTASYTSHSSSSASVSPTKPMSPMPSTADEGVSPATERSRHAALVGTILAIFVLLTLVSCFFCIRCNNPAFMRRKPKAQSQKYLQDQEKGSISEKGYGSPKSDYADGMMVPVLPSNAPTSMPHDPWRYIAHDGAQIQDASHVLVGGPYTEISLESNTDIHSHSGSVGGGSDRAIMGDRTSAGATSTTRTYSTCTSRYSGQSSDQGQDMSLDPIEFLPTFLCPPPPVVKQGRARSKTVTHASSGRYPSLTAVPVHSSKSFPANLSTSYHPQSRLSAESARSEITKRSTGSEWDIAQEYGRFSKESMGGSSILTTISEDSERMEAVEMGAKTCVLVTRKF